VARITRKELKTDKFALEVEHTVTFFEEHRKQIARVGTAAVVAALVIVALIFWNKQRHAEREAALSQALRTQEAPVGPSAPPGQLSFPTPEAKTEAARKAFSDVVVKYNGSQEAEIAEHYLGAIAADSGNLAEAEKRYKAVIDSGNKNYASLSAFALAQIYFVTNRPAEGEKLLRSLIDHPTMFVSSEQASLALARALAKSKPAEARKLLDPLRASRRPPISEAAIQLAAEIQQH